MRDESNLPKYPLPLRDLSAGLLQSNAKLAVAWSSLAPQAPGAEPLEPFTASDVKSYIKQYPRLGLPDSLFAVKDTESFTEAFFRRRLASLRDAAKIWYEQTLLGSEKMQKWQAEALQASMYIQRNPSMFPVQCLTNEGEEKLSSPTMPTVDQLPIMPLDCRLKVLSYNVAYFDAQEWRHEAMLKLVLAEEADVVALLEVSTAFLRVIAEDERVNAQYVLSDPKGVHSVGAHGGEYLLVNKRLCASSSSSTSSSTSSTSSTSSASSTSSTSITSNTSGTSSTSNISFAAIELPSFQGRKLITCDVLLRVEFPRPGISTECIHSTTFTNMSFHAPHIPLG
jgi:hypothetical protein